MKYTTRGLGSRIAGAPYVRPVLLAAVFGIIGVTAMLVSHAVTPTASLEVESATLSAKACAVSDSSASSSHAVKFSTGTCTSGDLPGLARIPWEGGPNYWKASNGAQFAKADVSGWDDPSFFPITVFLGQADPAKVDLYKSAGINTYAPPEHDPSVYPMTNITSKGLFAIAGLDYTQAEAGTNNNSVVGWFLSDECEMGSSGCDNGTTGQAAATYAFNQQTSFANQARGYNDGRFIMANFGNGIVRTYWASPYTCGTVDCMSAHVRLMDTSSADKYTYTSPPVDDLVSGSPDWPSSVPVARAYSYGWQADQIKRFQDPSNPKPVWTFIETSRPFLTESDAGTISPEQMEGAVWSALIHEARGISYFDHNNNDNSKYCMGYYAIPQCANVNCSGANASQAYCTVSTVKCATNDTTCGDSGGFCVTSDVHCFVQAVDAQVKALAPVLNTQSYYNTTQVVNGYTYYRYRFNNGTDTMLKTYDGSAYIFADLGMKCNNATCTSGTVDATGSKTFTLPTGVTGTSVEVVGESRTIPVSGGQFTDSFANEYTHHIYKVAL